MDAMIVRAQMLVVYCFRQICQSWHKLGLQTQELVQVPVHIGYQLKAGKNHVTGMNQEITCFKSFFPRKPRNLSDPHTVL
jgi:hypothetical protein